MNEPLNTEGVMYRIVGNPAGVVYAAIYRNGQFVGWAKQYSGIINATVEVGEKKFTTENHPDWNPLIEEIEDSITGQGQND